MSSLRFPFGIDTGLGEVAREADYGHHIDQLVRQVLLTAPGERVNRPFGCGLRQMVFAPLRDVTTSLTQIAVLEALNRWLGDVIRVENVRVDGSDESLEVHVAYYIRARGERRYLNLQVAL